MKEKGIRPGGIDVPDWSESAALEFMDGHGIQTGILSLSMPGVYFGSQRSTRARYRGLTDRGAVLVRPTGSWPGGHRERSRTRPRNFSER